MKHLILVKFKDSENRTKLLPEITALFEETLSIEGISRIRVIPCCSDRKNRYDLMIEMTMTSEALPVYDISGAHLRWKKEYGELLEAKTIFDYEES